MRTSPLLADFIHTRGCKPICEKLLTLPGVALQPLHGAAAVQDEYQFRQIFLHNKSPYAVLFGLQAQYRGISVWMGRMASDKLLCLKQGDLGAVLLQEPEQVLGFEPYGGGIVIGVYTNQAGALQK